MTTESDRHLFIGYLRSNPENLKQTRIGSLIDKEGAVCALGAGCKLFGIELVYGAPLNEMQGCYNKIDAILGLDKDLELKIWRMNDVKEFTFAQIADKLQEIWFNDN